MPQDYTGQNLSGQDFSGRNLRGAIFDRANLRGATFDGANLREAQFVGANLSQASLCGANLRGANLSCAILNRAILRFADLCKANLSDAELKYSNLENSKLFASTLQRAVFTGAWLRRADLSYADLSRANLESADLIGAKLLETVLTFAKLNRSKLKQAHVRRANLICAELRYCELDYCVLERADLSHSILEGARLTSTNLTSARLHNVNLKDAILERTCLKNADLSEADLSGVDLNEAILVDAILTGTNLSRTKFYKVNLSGSNIDGNDLSDIDLSDIDLSFAKLRGTDLTSSILCRANMQYADMTDANMQCADLRNANLSGSLLTGANLIKSNFINANLSIAEVNDVDLERAILIGANLLGACLEGSSLKDVNLTRSYLSFVKFDRNSDLTGVILKQACLRGADCEGVDFSRSLLDKIDMLCANINDIQPPSNIDFSFSDNSDKIDGNIGFIDWREILSLMLNQLRAFQAINEKLMANGTNLDSCDIVIDNPQENYNQDCELHENYLREASIHHKGKKIKYEVYKDHHNSLKKLLEDTKKRRDTIILSRSHLRNIQYQPSPKYNANPFYVNNHLEPFLIAAGSRAIESVRQDSLFDDELALPLIGEKIRDFVRELYTDENKPYIPIRTKFFDDFLLNTLADHGANAIQVIFLGSGLDTRPFRLKQFLLNATIYELDKPDVIQKKVDRLTDIRACTLFHDLIEENSNHHFIKEDLTSDTWIESLYAKGYSSSQASIWIIEGLFVYLEPDEVCKLLQNIQSHSTHSSWIGADLIDQQALLRYQRYSWKSGFDDPRQLFTQYSWRDIEIKTPDDESVNHGRYIPSENSNDGRAFFVTARKM